MRLSLIKGRRPILAVVSCCLISTSALAQSNDTLMLMNRINDLESQVQTLSRQVGRGDSGPNSGGQGGYAAGGNMADTDVRISQLQDQVRNLTGEVESESNAVSQLKTQIDRMNAENLARMTTSDPSAGNVQPPIANSTAPMYGPATQPTQLTQPQPGVLGTLPENATTGSSQSTAATSPEKDYEAAYNSLGQGDYGSAEKGFRSFLSRYPKHALAANAEYWLGETYYARNMFDQASATFADSYKNYPNGAKAPDSLLKLGMSLGQQKKPQEACLTFGELAKQFPAASQKIKSAVAQERANYKCP